MDIAEIWFEGQTCASSEDDDTRIEEVGEARAEPSDLADDVIVHEGTGFSREIFFWIFCLWASFFERSSRQKLFDISAFINGLEWWLPRHEEHAADFSRKSVRTSEELSIDYDSTTNSCSCCHDHNDRMSFPCAKVCFGKSRAMDVIIDEYGEVEDISQFFLERNVFRVGNIGESESDSFGVCDEARYTDANGLCFFGAEFLNESDASFEYVIEPFFCVGWDLLESLFLKCFGIVASHRALGPAEVDSDH